LIQPHQSAILKGLSEDSAFNVTNNKQQENLVCYYQMIGQIRDEKYYLQKITLTSLTHLPWLPVLILAFGFYIYSFDAKIHFGGDNAEYYQLGQGFTLNKGYVMPCY